MANTIFYDGVTPIVSDWLNAVNNLSYSKTFPDGSVALSAQPGTSLDSSAVSFVPSGTGAVATTAQIKLRENVSVKDFGASTGAIASVNATAFAKAWTASNPQAVLVPAGTYLLTGTVTGKFYSFGAVTISGGTVTSITNLVP